MTYSQSYRIRWADLDPNVHMRHSAYNDYAAQTRLQFLTEHGFGMGWFKKHDVYPVLFREETVFLKEFGGSELVTVDVWLQRINTDATRWTMVNCFLKEDGMQAAKLTVDGSWISLTTRKLKPPPGELIQLMNTIDKTADFELITATSKS
ncbi:MAG TPA: acyl-CoA thioesterase [Bacteroidia bacterium]|nr:acyl-CoA thioesterase [Bacteroidia bacterium]